MVAIMLTRRRGPVGDELPAIRREVRPARLDWPQLVVELLFVAIMVVGIVLA